MTKTNENITKKDFNSFMREFLNNNKKTTLGVPKRPKKAELETSYKIEKIGDSYSMNEVDG